MVKINEDKLSSLNPRKLYGVVEKDRGLKASISRIFEAKKRNFRCTKKLIGKYLPITKWMRTFDFRQNAVSEIIAGFVVAVMHIPQGMAYALLAGLDNNPVVGIYTAIFPVLVYLFLCPSPHVSNGTNPLTSILVSNVVDRLVPETNRDSNSTSIDEGSSPSDVTPIEVVAAISLASGVWQLFFYLCRLGKYSWILSEVLVSGYTTASAFHVLSSQLKGLFGLEGVMKRQDEIPKLFYVFYDFFINVPSINIAALIISVSSVLLQVFNNEFLKARAAKYCKFPIPIQAIVVILGTVISYGMNLNENYGVSIVQSIPSGLPAPGIPRFEIVRSVIMDSLVIAIVGYSITLSMGKIFGTKFKYPVDGSQEILAESSANIFGSFFGSLPAAASMSRSLVQVGAGCKSQITSLMSITFLVIFAFFAGPLFSHLPKAILASIIVVALKGMFLQLHDFYKFYSISKVDGLLWMATFIFTIIFYIDYGLYASIGLSFLILINRHSEPRVVELGAPTQLKGENDEVFLEIDSCENLSRVSNGSNVTLLRVIGSVDFTNYESVVKYITKMQRLYSYDQDNEIEIGVAITVLDLSSVPRLDQTAVKYLKVWLESGSNIFVAIPGSNPDTMLVRCGVKSSYIFPSIKCALKVIPAIQLPNENLKLSEVVNHGYVTHDEAKVSTNL